MTRGESLRPDMPVDLRSAGAAILYREFVETSAQVIEETVDGTAVLVAEGHLAYVTSWLDAAALTRDLT